ncbi:MAG: ABC-2 type transport system permease protein [Planctomycetota bacterium]|jgi:ABC-2 type transport system permease protein
MNKKTLLIGLREFHENLRTKTFWIGIFVFPVILLASFIVPSWLEDQKDVRVFSVLDQSEWLAADVEARSAFPDIASIFEDVAKQHKAGTPDPEWPPLLAKIAPALSEMDPAGRKQMADGFVRFESLKSTMPELLDRIPQQQRMEFEKSLSELRTWWQGLSANAARDELGSFNLAKQDYELRDFTSEGQTVDEHRTLLEGKLRDGSIFAYFEINGDPVTGKGEFFYNSRNITDSGLKNWFERHANTAVRAKRFEKNEIDEQLVREIQAPLVFSKQTIGKDGQQEVVDSQKTAHSFIPAAFVYLLWITIFMMAQMLLTNTIEEKSNRTIEVLLSSVAPIELMAGKIGGIAATGLTMILAWICFFFLIVKFALPALNVEAPFDITPLLTDPTYLASFVVYFMFGYLLYAALIAGIGSVCNSLKEAQNLMMPVSVFLMLPLMAMIPVVQSPNGGLAKTLSYIPPLTPFIMMNRAAGPPTTFEYVVTTIILIVSIAVTFYAAAKIFRIGILMTGKPPKVREILRWLKAPVGAMPDMESKERD